MLDILHCDDLAARLADPSRRSAALRAAAAGGELEAQALLGQVLLDEGDARAGFVWFNRAAAAGHLMALNMVGRCYDLGWGVAVDKHRAAECFRVAAARGLPEAMYNHATALALGDGCAEDKAAALALFERADAAGFAKAANHVGSFAEDGWVHPRDMASARRCYARAAEGGDFRGMFNHARMLAEDGDEEAALGWLVRCGKAATTAFVVKASDWLALLPTPAAACRRPGFADPVERMLIAVPDVLDAAHLAEVRGILDRADWIDGNATSGTQSALAKRNRQLDEDDPAAAESGRIVLDALSASPLFVAAALPLKVFPPLFNRYEAGETFGLHVDTAVRIRRGTDFRLRADLSATLFLAEPDSYEGGALVIEHAFGTEEIKLPAGHLVLYPASSLHKVTPVTRGVRTASFFWLQSMVRDDAARRTLFELDEGVQAAAATLGADDPAVVKLTGVYHNLLRRWADV